MLKTIFAFLIIFLTYQINAQDCGGTERWDVKVMADNEAKQINLSPLLTTISWLRNQKVHRMKGDETRQGIEFQAYEVKCYIKFYKKEKDGDLHIVICDTRNGKKTMIAEVPGPKCKLVRQSGFADHYQEVWDYIEKNTTSHSNEKYFMKNKKYTINGIAFIDFNHNQTGRAPNDLELHPIYYIK